MFCDPRLAIITMLRGLPDSFGCHFGLKCSSFCKMNIGTSCRSACTPIGFEDYLSVKIGNMLLERIVFLNYGALILNNTLFGVLCVLNLRIVYLDVLHHWLLIGLTLKDMLIISSVHGSRRSMVFRTTRWQPSRILPRLPLCYPEHIHVRRSHRSQGPMYILLDSERYDLEACWH